MLPNESSSSPAGAIYRMSYVLTFCSPGGSTGPAFRTRAERIQAIKDAATALKTRLNSEVQKMSHDLAGDPIGETRQMSHYVAR